MMRSALALALLLPLLAQAECGWLLMTPPIGDGDQPDVRAPLAQWHQQGAYDSAGECQAAIEAAYVRAKAEPWPEPRNLEEAQRLLRRAQSRLALMQGRCLPASSVPIK